jgi:phosphate acetyltransferase
MVEAACGLTPIRTAVVHPRDENSLRGVMDANEAGLIIPILVGPRPKVLAATEAAGLTLDHLELIHVQHSHAAAAKGSRSRS